MKRRYYAKRMLCGCWGVYDRKRLWGDEIAWVSDRKTARKIATQRNASNTEGKP